MNPRSGIHLILVYKANTLSIYFGSNSYHLLMSFTRAKGSRKDRFHFTYLRCHVKGVIIKNDYGKNLNQEYPPLSLWHLIFNIWHLIFNITYWLLILTLHFQLWFQNEFIFPPRTRGIYTHVNPNQRFCLNEIYMVMHFIRNHLIYGWDKLFWSQPGTQLGLYKNLYQSSDISLSYVDQFWEFSYHQPFGWNFQLSIAFKFKISVLDLEIWIRKKKIQV